MVALVRPPKTLQEAYDVYGKDFVEGPGVASMGRIADYYDQSGNLIEYGLKPATGTVETPFSRSEIVSESEPMFMMPVYNRQLYSDISGIVNTNASQDYLDYLEYLNTPNPIYEHQQSIPTPDPTPTPAPQSQGIETIADLASRNNLSPDIVAQFSQQNKPRSGNDADPEPRPTFYGYSGDLSGLTGRWLGQAELGLESGPGRPETYADVLARARRAEQERNQD